MQPKMLKILEITILIWRFA